MTPPAKPTPRPKTPWRGGWELVLAVALVTALPFVFLTCVGFVSGTSFLGLCGLISTCVVANGARKEPSPAKHVRAALWALAFSTPIAYMVIAIIIQEGLSGEDLLQALTVVTLASVVTVITILILALRRTRTAR